MEIGAAGTPLCHDRLCESKPAARGRGGRPTPASPAGPENSDRWRISGTYGPLSRGIRCSRSPARQAPEPAGRRLCTDPRNQDRRPPGVWLRRLAGWPQYPTCSPEEGSPIAEKCRCGRAPVREARCCVCASRASFSVAHRQASPIGSPMPSPPLAAPTAGACKRERSSRPWSVNRFLGGHCTRYGPCKGARERQAVESGLHEGFGQRDTPGV